MNKEKIIKIIAILSLTSLVFIFIAHITHEVGHIIACLITNSKIIDVKIDAIRFGTNYVSYIPRNTNSLLFITAAGTIFNLIIGTTICGIAIYLKNIYHFSIGMTFIIEMPISIIYSTISGFGDFAYLPPILTIYLFIYSMGFIVLLIYLYKKEMLRNDNA